MPLTKIRESVEFGVFCFLILRGYFEFNFNVLSIR